MFNGVDETNKGEMAQMSDTKYIKKQDLVGAAFTIEKVWAPQWTRWDSVARTMAKSDVPAKGHSKTYNVVTNKGTVSVSANMLGQFLEAVQVDGSSSIIGATFNLGTNGKTGMEIRYFVNVVSGEEEDAADDSVNIDDIPF